MDYLHYLQNLPGSPNPIQSREEWGKQYPGVQDPVLCGAIGLSRTFAHPLAKECKAKLPINHVQGCTTCLHILNRLDPNAFKTIVLSGSSHDCPRKASLEMLRYIDGDKVIAISSAIPHIEKDSQLILDNFANEEKQLISILPCLDFNEMQNAPSYPGIYFVTTYIEGAQAILYIGKARNIRERWKSHHRSPEINLLIGIGMNVNVHFLIIPEPAGCDENLLELESHYIKTLQPKFNYKPVSKSLQSSHGFQESSVKLSVVGDICKLEDYQVIGKKPGFAEERIRRTVDAIQKYNKNRSRDEQIGINVGSLRVLSATNAASVGEYCKEHAHTLKEYAESQGHTYRQNIGKDLTALIPLAWNLQKQEAS